MRNALQLISATTLGLTLALTAGCRVDEHKDGNSENVKIATPFGGMTVKTDQAVVEGGVGLATYPGATVIKKDNDNNAADVNMNFGSFHLGVKAISYYTPDSPDKVIAFYKKDMARYGVVILCRGNHAEGVPDHTSDGLSCEKDRNTKVNVDDDSGDQELKAGSKQHQHIVGIDTKGSGTKIGLVALDLPGNFKTGDEKQ